MSNSGSLFLSVSLVEGHRYATQGRGTIRQVQTKSQEKGEGKEDIQLEFYKVDQEKHNGRPNT